MIVRHPNLEVRNTQTEVRLNLFSAPGTFVVATATPKVCPVRSAFLVLVKIQDCFLVIHGHISSSMREFRLSGRIIEVFSRPACFSDRRWSRTAFNSHNQLL